MDCDLAVQSLASVFDDKIEEPKQDPFKHLDTCPKCLVFFGNLLLLRGIELIAEREWGNHGVWGPAGQAGRISQHRPNDEPSVMG